MGSSVGCVSKQDRPRDRSRPGRTTSGTVGSRCAPGLDRRVTPFRSLAFRPGAIAAFRGMRASRTRQADGEARQRWPVESSPLHARTYDQRNPLARAARMDVLEDPPQSVRGLGLRQRRCHGDPASGSRLALVEHAGVTCA